MGIVAHPGEVTSMDVSFDGKFIFSAGGFDLSVNMWRVDVEQHSRYRHDLKRQLREELAEVDAEAEEEAAGGGGISRTRNGQLVCGPVSAAAAVESMKPFFTLLEGGEGGELHQDIVDYFYYCQLRHLGEDSMETRELTGKCFFFQSFYCLNFLFISFSWCVGDIPLEEIPSLFRSVGYYPTEDEVANIINEVRFKNFVNTGETQEYVGLVSV
jgi:cilia- and flagella-associated protein 251